MKIPSFVPLVETERKKRERIGFFLEILVWAYLSVVASRILFWGILCPFLEEAAFSGSQNKFAESALAYLGYDRYAELSWSQMGVFFGVGAFVGVLVGLTGKGFGPFVASLSKLQVHQAEDSLKIQKHWKWAKKEGVLLLSATVITGWVLTKVNIGSMIEAEGLIGTGRMVLQLICGVPLLGIEFFGVSFFHVVQGVFNAIVTLANSFRGSSEVLPMFQSTCVITDAQYYGTALTKLAESIYLAFMATFFAVPIAFIASFFAARNLTRATFLTRSLYTVVRTYINITRSIEPIIWAILFAVWIGIGPFAGSIALMIHSISSLIKQYSEAVESIDEGPLEALQATGANRIATTWFAVVPQVILPYMAFTIYRWDINVRMATIIGLVGGGGIGGLLIQEQGLANWSKVGTLAFLIFIVVWTMDFLSAKIREAIQ
jgi:phosphonate transport system permease protein